MTQVSTEIGLLYPSGPFLQAASGGVKTMDATAEKAAVMGHLFIEGRATGKVLSAAGGGSITFRASTVTFAAVGPASTLDVGIQDLTATPSTIKPEPDGTYDVKATLTSGVDSIASNAWKAAVMTSGSKTMSHGDLIGIVLDLTARNGADSVTWTTISVPPNRPASNQFIAGAWGSSAQTDLPIAYITFDDGTLGVLYSADFITFGSPATGEAFQDSTNPDERGMLFQVPWNCKTEGARIYCNSGGASAADFDFKIYSDPLGTPTLLASVSIEGGQLNNNDNAISILFASKINLSKNTDYCMTVKATGAANITLSAMPLLPNTNLRKFLSGGTTLKKVTRNNNAGAFTAESPAVTIYNMKLLLNDFEDAAGGGGGMLMGNLRGNMQ